MNLIDKYKDDIEIKDLPEQYQLIAEECGLDTALSIASLFEGSYIYFPKIDQFIQYFRDKRIIKEFNGRNYKILAKKYSLSEVRIRQIIKQNNKQTNIFDFINK